jgi:hypothetical protein
MKKLITAFALILLLSSTVDTATPPDGTARLAPEIIEAAHRYHGILVSEQDLRGNCYFYRGGVRCKLLSEAFLAFYRGKR